jgi:hypothetical protein
LDVAGIDAIVAVFSAVSRLLARAELTDLPASQRRRSTRERRRQGTRLDSGGADNKFCFLRTGAALEGQISMDVLASGRGLIEIYFPLSFMIAVHRTQVV